MTSQDFVERARSLVGCAFRPQGRNPQFGLDCVGLVLVVFQIEARQVRRDYRLRGSHKDELRAGLSRFFVPVANPRAGDVLLSEVARNQMHLMINCGTSFVHADAGLRRIVETPGQPCWPIAAFRYPHLIQD